MDGKITHEQLGILIERIDANEFKCGEWYPTMEELKKYIGNNVKDNFEFLVWIATTSEGPRNDEEMEAEKWINGVIKASIV